MFPSERCNSLKFVKLGELVQKFEMQTSRLKSTARWSHKPSVVLSKKGRQSDECRKKGLKEVLYGSEECKTGGKDRQNWEKVGKFVQREIYIHWSDVVNNAARERKERKKKKLSLEYYRGGNGNERKINICIFRKYVSVLHICVSLWQVVFFS